MVEMTEIEKIFGEYTRLRGEGADIKTALAQLQEAIEQLEDSAKRELARQLRAAEAGKSATSAAAVQRIGAINPDEDSTATVEFEIVWINCPHCGRSNQRHELLCYACGRLLERVNSQNETQALAETNDLTLSDDFFGQDSVLILKLRTSETAFEVRPQSVEQYEIILGRSGSGSAIMPDVDLASIEGEKYGVSRLHLSIRYQHKHNTLSLFDLGSANGSYINGQRLHPHEVRVLRHGDELRLGKLVLRVAYRHH